MDELLTLEKEIKSEISAAWAYLTVKTKETIENLTPEQITDMLHEKWIVPIVNNLNQLPEIMLREFVSRSNCWHQSTLLRFLMWTLKSVKPKRSLWHDG